MINIPFTFTECPMKSAAAASFRAAAELPDRDDEPIGVGPENLEPSTPVVRYSPNDAAIATVKTELAPIVADAPALVKAPEGYERVHRAIMLLVPMRTAIEKRRKVLKADSLEYGRRVDAEAKRLTGLIEEIELPLRSAKDAIDEERRRESARLFEEAKAKREAEEKAARDAEEARLKAIRDAETARLKAEREQFEREKAAAAEEQAKRDAEARRLEAEQAAERARLERERQAADAAARAEREKIEAERRAVQAEKERLDRIEFERQAREKAEAEAKINAERLAKERAKKAEEARLAAEAAEKARLAAEAEEARRIEAARPDVEKIRGYGAFLRGLVLPDVKTEAARNFVSNLRVQIETLADNCEAFTVSRKKGGAAR